jgi:hypothetical protein
MKKIYILYKKTYASDILNVEMKKIKSIHFQSPAHHPK